MADRTIEQRLQRLEAIEAIRLLKHRYLNACDLKDIDTIRDCFACGEVHIDYGPVGVFTDRNRFIDLYRQEACHEYVIDLHHGANPEIEILDDDHARGRWALYYFNINAQSGATRQLGGFYQDEYQLINGAWKITATCFTAHSLLECPPARG